MIKNFIDFINENMAPDEIETPNIETNNSRTEVLDLLKAIINGNLSFVKGYFEKHINDKNIETHIVSQIVKCVFNGQKEICEYLLNLEPINNSSFIKDNHIINNNIEYLFRSAISTAKDLNKLDMMEMIIQQYDRNGVKRPSEYSGKEPIDNLYENNAPDDDNITNTDATPIDIKKDLIRAVEKGNIDFIKDYVNKHSKDKNIYKTISIEVLRSIVRNRKDVCEYLLGLDIMNSGQIDKYYHVTDLGYNLKEAILYCEYTKKHDFLKILIDWHNKNGIETKYSGDQPDEKRED